MILFGDNLRRIREKENMTQNDLAQMLYISPGTITAWETGRVMPRLDMAVDVANFFGVSLDELCGIRARPARIGTDKPGK